MHFFRVLSAIWKNAIATLFAYRGSFFLSILWGFGWAGYSIGVLKLFFSHTDSIHGWSKPDMILLYITMQLSSFVLSAVIYNIEQLGSYIQLGTLDVYLTKPIDTQLLVLFGKPNISLWLRQASYVIPLIALLFIDPPAIVPAYAPLYFFLLLFGGIIWIMIETILMTLNFWWQKIDNIKELLFNSTEIAKYPITVFPKILQIVFFSIYPIAFAAFVPAQALLGVFSWSHIFLAVIITALFVIAARLLWGRAIKKYESASS